MKPSAGHSMYFLAIVCPAPVNEKILHFKKWMKEQFGCLAALRSPAHITLIPPFWLEEVREGALLDTLGSFKVENEFIIELEGFSHFGKRVLFAQVIKSPWLDKVRREIDEHFIKNFSDVIKTEDRPFQAHVTIANRDMLPNHFLKAWEHFSRLEFSEQVAVEKISILKLVEGKWKIIE